VDAALSGPYHHRVAGQRKNRGSQRLLKAVRAKASATGPVVNVRRLHRRDLNKVWEFLKRSFRDVNLETVEYQRPRSKKRFYETYEEEGVEQLLFEVEGETVAYTECTYEILGSDTWINPRYFEKRDMRPLFVEELAVHPAWHGRGVGSFVLEQIQHLAKVRGLTHLVLEVAENNPNAMSWYRKRGFRKLDAAVFMAYAVDVAPELLPPRALETEREEAAGAEAAPVKAGKVKGKKVADKVGEKAVAKAEEKVAAKPGEKVAAKLGEKPVPRAGEKLVMKVAAKPGEKIAVKPLAALRPGTAAPAPGAPVRAASAESGPHAEARNGQRRPAATAGTHPAPPAPGRRRT
jgi:ribosomal protein S18 acetylase RimI-like enzyme